MARPLESRLRPGKDDCANCRVKKVYARNLCKPCQMYLLRNGEMRPHSVAAKLWHRERAG